MGRVHVARPLPPRSSVHSGLSTGRGGLGRRSPPARASSLVVPSSAVLYSPAGPYVLVAAPDGRTLQQAARGDRQGFARPRGGAVRPARGRADRRRQRVLPGRRAAPAVAAAKQAPRRCDDRPRGGVVRPPSLDRHRHGAAFWPWPASSPGGRSRATRSPTCPIPRSCSWPTGWGTRRRRSPAA